MSNEEQSEFLEEILNELAPVLSVEKLEFLSHCCGKKVSDWYGSKREEAEVLEIIDWKEAA